MQSVYRTFYHASAKIRTESDSANVDSDQSFGQKVFIDKKWRQTDEVQLMTWVTINQDKTRGTKKLLQKARNR